MTKSFPSRKVNDSTLSKFLVQIGCTSIVLLSKIDGGLADLHFIWSDNA